MSENNLCRECKWRSEALTVLWDRIQEHAEADRWLSTGMPILPVEGS